MRRKYEAALWVEAQDQLRRPFKRTTRLYSIPDGGRGSEPSRELRRADLFAPSFVAEGVDDKLYHEYSPWLREGLRLTMHNLYIFDVRNKAVSVIIR